MRLLSDGQSEPGPILRINDQQMAAEFDFDWQLKSTSLLFMTNAWMSSNFAFLLKQKQRFWNRYSSTILKKRRTRQARLRLGLHKVRGLRPEYTLWFAPLAENLVTVLTDGLTEKFPCVLWMFDWFFGDASGYNSPEASHSSSPLAQEDWPWRAPLNPSD